MSLYGVEEIDRLLENLQQAHSQIDDIRTDPISVDELYLLSSVILEVLGWSNTAYGEQTFGINPSLLNKFVKMRGTVSKQQALMVSERLRTFLRSQGQGNSVPEDLDVTKVKMPIPQIRPVFTVEVKGWAVIPGDSQIKQKIHIISSLLDSIILQIKHTNLPPDQQALSEIERQQLITVLETALNLLRSPMVEKGMLRKAGDMLRKNAGQAAEKELQEGLGGLMSVGGKLIGEMIKSLFGP
jgi:hypothetical protein